MQRVWSTYLDSQGVQHRRDLSDNVPDSDSPRSSSRASMAHSTHSSASSTRHILGDYNPDRPSSNPPPYPTSNLNPNMNPYGLNPNSAMLTVPGAPYSAASSTGGFSPKAPLSPYASTTGLSLMVNYLPSKFGTSVASRRRGGDGAPTIPNIPKQGGGLAAFKPNEQRMGEGPGAGRGPRKLRWTKFKWALFAANLLLSLYSLAGLIILLLTWFNVWPHSEIIRIGNRTELILSTIAAVLGILTSLIGFAGILLNNRPFLAVYSLLTWITFAFLVTPGYLTYRRRTYNLEGKINAQWSRDLGAAGRQRIQNELECCGYFSPYVEATVSQTCYSRSILPGCKLPYMKYERYILDLFWKSIFSLVPAQLLVMIVALMCSNHVTYRFGKGMMPRAYRLDVGSMGVIMDMYAAQLAEQYGPDVATKALENSRSNLNLKGGYSESFATSAR